MDTQSYISPNKITKQYDVTSGTLRRWSESGKIRFLRPNGGKRIYHIDDINKMFSNTKGDTKSNNTNLQNIKENIKQLESFDSIEELENEINKISEMIATIKQKEIKAESQVEAN